MLKKKKSRSDFFGGYCTYKALQRTFVKFIRWTSFWEPQMDRLCLGWSVLIRTTGDWTVLCGLHGAPHIFIKLPRNSSTEGTASKIPKKNGSGAAGSADSTYCYTCAIREKDKLHERTSGHRQWDHFDHESRSRYTWIRKRSRNDSSRNVSWKRSFDSSKKRQLKLQKMAKKNSCR